MTIYKRLSEVPATSNTPSSLPPEVEEGNVEYKLKLANPSASRFEHLITQMNWRLKEGDGKAYYAIGVEDNGTVSGLSDQELQSSLQTLRRMAHKLGAKIAKIEPKFISSGQEGRHAADVTVEKIPDKQDFINIRVACVGNVDVGKSTLLGVLSHGGLDNGRGCARLNMFRHLHEIQTGHTSSISHQMLGFDSDGQELNSNDLTAEEICGSAAKLITFLDLAGHQKYLKTTILGLTGYSPDIVMLVVAANRGIAGTTKEHLGLAIALKLPFVIVVTKTDICAEDVTNRTVAQLKRILKSPGCNKDPLLVQSTNDVECASRNFSIVTPIFTVSSVNGQHLELLRKFYSLLPPLKSETEQKSLIDRPPQFQVDEIYSVCDVGQVVGGTLRYGRISVGDELVVGPMSDGGFQPVEVASLHRNRTPCLIIQAGQTACIAFNGNTDYFFRRGQVLLRNVIPPKPSKIFQAELLLLFHTTKINVKFQATLHIGNIVQTAIVKEIFDKDYVQTGQKAKVTFEFMKQAEYIENGDRIFFREGQSKDFERSPKKFV